MTASAGIAINAGLPTMPQGMSAGCADKPSDAGASADSASSFRSAMQDCHSQEDAPKAVRDSSPKRTSKDNSEPENKSDKKPETDDQGSVPVPVPLAAPVPVLPLTFTLPQLGTLQDVRAAGAPAFVADEAAANASLITTPEAMPLSEELLQLSDAAVEDQPSSSTPKPGELAFAARLSPSQEDPAPAPAAPPRLPVIAASPVRPAGQAAVPQKYLPGGSVTEDADRRDPKESREAEPLFKMSATIPSAGSAGEAAPSTKNSAPQAFESTAVQAMKESTLEPAAAAPTSSHDFRVRVPDNQGGSMDVRFLESGGEVRVSVRTPDNNLAQTLRGQLNQLTQQLSAGGIQTELWQPGSDRSFHQNAQQESQDSRHGSGGGRREQEQQQQSNQNKPRWLEELELSGGTR